MSYQSVLQAKGVLYGHRLKEALGAFDEFQGTVYDLNQLQGTINYDLAASPVTNEVSARSIQLASAAAAAKTSSTYDWSSGTTQYAFNLWLFINANQGAELFSTGAWFGANDPLDVFLNTDGRLSWYAGGASATTPLIDPMPLTQWVMLTFVITPGAGTGTVNIYRNGVIWQQYTNLTIALAAGKRISLGQAVNGVAWTGGNYAEPSAFRNAGLVAVDVDDIFDAATAAAPAAPVAVSLTPSVALTNIIATTAAKENIAFGLTAVFDDADGWANITNIDLTNLPANWARTLGAITQVNPTRAQRVITVTPWISGAAAGYNLNVRATDAGALTAEIATGLFAVGNDAPVWPALVAVNSPIARGMSPSPRTVNAQAATDPNGQDLAYTQPQLEFSPDNGATPWVVLPHASCPAPPGVTTGAVTAATAATHTGATTLGFYRVTKRATDG